MPSRVAIVAGVLFALVGAAPAGASKLITLATTSRYVDVAHEHFDPPPDTAVMPPSMLPVNVLLPDGFDPRKRYPVLYLLHGHGATYDHWRWPANGDVANVVRGFGGIVVMPEAGRSWYTNRWAGGARTPAWERYHLDELLPLIERRLPIMRGRAHHAIAGMSMGGEGAMFYAEQRPGYFGAVASFSGVLSLRRPEWPQAFDTQGERHVDVYGDPSAQRFYWQGHDPTALASNLRGTRVYVTVGDGVDSLGVAPTNFTGVAGETELRQHAEDFVGAARAAGDDVTYVPRHGIHDWPYWRIHLAAAIEWGFFGGSSAMPHQWSYRTVAQHGTAWDMTFDFAAPPGELITFTREGTRLGAMGTGRVTLRFPHRRRVTWALPFANRKLPARVPRRHRRPS